MIRLIHDQTGPLLIDFETQTYQRLPDTRNKIFFNGQMFDYAETFEDVKKNCIVPVWCESVGTKGKRIFCTLLSGNQTYIFFNIEKVGSGWLNNRIEQIAEKQAYFVYVEKNNMAENGLIILSSKKINKKS